MFHKLNYFIFVIFLTISASTCWSQYLFVQELTSNGFKGMMAFKATTQTYVTPTAKSETTDMQFTGTFMKRFNQKTNKADIIRLDKDVFWSIDYDKKQYTEMTFNQLKKMWESGAGQGMPAGMGNKEESSEDEYEWEKPVVKVHKKETGKKINGFKCNHYIVDMIVVGTHKETGIKDTMIVTNDTWNTTVTSNAMKVMKKFNQKLIGKLGMEQPMAGMGQMIAAYKEYLGELSDETKKLEGYPIRSIVQIKSTNHVKAAQEKGETEDENIDLGKNPLGGMLGGFAKKMAKMKESQKTGNIQELFQYTTELKSIKKLNAPEKIKIPAGFKKVTSGVE